MENKMKVSTFVGVTLVILLLAFIGGIIVGFPRLAFAFAFGLLIVIGVRIYSPNDVKFTKIVVWGVLGTVAAFSFLSAISPVISRTIPLTSKAFYYESHSFDIFWWRVIGADPIVEMQRNEIAAELASIKIEQQKMQTEIDVLLDKQYNKEITRDQYVSEREPRIGKMAHLKSQYDEFMSQLRLLDPKNKNLVVGLMTLRALGFIIFFILLAHFIFSWSSKGYRETTASYLAKMNSILGGVVNGFLYLVFAGSLLSVLAFAFDTKTADLVHNNFRLITAIFIGVFGFIPAGYLLLKRKANGGQSSHTSQMSSADKVKAFKMLVAVGLVVFLVLWFFPNKNNDDAQGLPPMTDNMMMGGNPADLSSLLPGAANANQMYTGMNIGPNSGFVDANSTGWTPSNMVLNDGVHFEMEPVNREISENEILILRSGNNTPHEIRPKKLSNGRLGWKTYGVGVNYDRDQTEFRLKNGEPLKINWRQSNSINALN